MGTRFQEARAHKLARRTTGDISISSTTWVNVDTALDLVLAAAVGDMVEVGASFIYDAVAGSEFYFDVVSVVAAAPVNTWGLNGAELAAGEGIQAWRAPALSSLQKASGGIRRAVVAGDLASGYVTLRLRTRLSGGAARNIYCGTNRYLTWWATNLGPADPN